jgi:hypothetical protein
MASRRIPATDMTRRRLKALASAAVERCLDQVAPGLEGGREITEADCWLISGTVLRDLTESDLCRRGR